MMLTVENLHKSYQVGQTTYEVLKGISLEVEKGEFVAVMGPSGSGKTTLLNCISCYIPADCGEIILGDRPLAALDETALAAVRNKQLGFVFQDFLLHLPLILLLILFVCKLLTLSFIICTEAPLYLHAIRYGLVLSCFLFRL